MESGIRIPYSAARMLVAIDRLPPEIKVIRQRKQISST